MADFTLSNGDGVTFDMYKISIKEYREILDPACPQDKQDSALSKLIDIPIEKLLELPQRDYQGICEAFVKRISTPLDDEKN